MKFKNKWTTMGGILVAVGALIGAVGQLVLGEVGLAVESLRENWMALVAGIALLKAADGGL